MSADADRLHVILDELHALLESEHALADDDVGALQKAAGDIREALGEQGPDPDEGMMDQLNRALERFEGKHPKLTELVGRIADALSDIGI